MNLNKLLSVVFVTFSRDEAAVRFVSSLRKFYPDLPVLVADQNGPTEGMKRFYHQNKVSVLWLPSDCGLSFARNRAFEQVQTPYVLLADDDFIISQMTNLQSAVEILEQDRRIGFLGGRLIDIRTASDGAKVRYLRRWEKYLFLVEQLKTLISVPIDYLPLQSKRIAGHEIFLCDMTLNWGLMRRAVFSNTIRWDERIKINGEHEDFFLSLKHHSAWKVAFFPDLVCEHEQPHVAAYHKFRRRLAGREILAEKWGLEHHLEIGVGLRSFSQYLAFDRVPIPHEKLNSIDGEPGLPVAPEPISSKNHQEQTELHQKVDPNPEILALRREVVSLRESLSAKTSSEEALRQSWSWKFTSPLRFLANALTLKRSE